MWLYLKKEGIFFEVIGINKRSAVCNTEEGQSILFETKSIIGSRNSAFVILK